jgi:hypothetical protein
MTIRYVDSDDLFLTIPWGKGEQAGLLLKYIRSIVCIGRDVLRLSKEDFIRAKPPNAPRRFLLVQLVLVRLKCKKWRK